MHKREISRSRPCKSVAVQYCSQCPKWILCQTMFRNITRRTQGGLEGGADCIREFSQSKLYKAAQTKRPTEAAAKLNWALPFTWTHQWTQAMLLLIAACYELPKRHALELKVAVDKVHATCASQHISAYVCSTVNGARQHWMMATKKPSTWQNRLDHSDVN